MDRTRAGLLEQEPGPRERPARGDQVVDQRRPTYGRADDLRQLVDCVHRSATVAVSDHEVVLRDEGEIKRTVAVGVAHPNFLEVRLHRPHLWRCEPAIDREFGTVDFLILMDGQSVNMSALHVLLP